MQTRWRQALLSSPQAKVHTHHASNTTYKKTHSSAAAADFAGLRLNMLAMDGCLRSLNLCMQAEDRAQGGCVAGASRSLSSAKSCQNQESAG